MNAVPAVAVVDGMTWVTVPAEACPACDGALQPRVDQPLDALARTSSASCPTHMNTLRVTDEDLVLTMRTPRATSSLNRTPLRTAMRNSLHYPDDALRAVRSVLHDPERWLVTDRADSDQMVRALDWAVPGRGASEMERWVSADIPFVEDADDWRTKGFTERQARAWRANGVERGWLAEQWRAAGASARHASEYPTVAAYRFVRGTTLPQTPQWGALWEHVNSDFAEEGFAKGATAEQVRVLGRALAKDLPTEFSGDRENNGVTMAWSRARSSRLLAVVQPLCGSEWQGLGWCLLAGMELDEAKAYLASGADIEPVRLMAAMA